MVFTDQQTRVIGRPDDSHGFHFFFSKYLVVQCNRATIHHKVVLASLIKYVCSLLGAQVKYNTALVELLQVTLYLYVHDAH